MDDEDQNTDDLSLGKKVKIDLADMDYVSWRESLAKDAEVLELLTLMVGDITPEHDSKLQELYRVIDDKIAHPINEGNKKIIIFTAFADTAGYLYDNVSKYVKSKYGLNRWFQARWTVAQPALNCVGFEYCPYLLLRFQRINLFDSIPADIDILIATDCISRSEFAGPRFHQLRYTLIGSHYSAFRSN